MPCFLVFVFLFWSPEMDVFHLKAVIVTSSHLALFLVQNHVTIFLTDALLILSSHKTEITILQSREVAICSHNLKSF